MKKTIITFFLVVVTVVAAFSQKSVTVSPGLVKLAEKGEVLEREVYGMHHIDSVEITGEHGSSMIGVWSSDYMIWEKRPEVVIAMDKKRNTIVDYYEQMVDEAASLTDIMYILNNAPSSNFDTTSYDPKWLIESNAKLEERYQKTKERLLAKEVYTTMCSWLAGETKTLKRDNPDNYLGFELCITTKKPLAQYNAEEILFFYNIMGDITDANVYWEPTDLKKAAAVLKGTDSSFATEAAHDLMSWATGAE